MCSNVVGLMLTVYLFLEERKIVAKYRLLLPGGGWGWGVGGRGNKPVVGEVVMR